MANVTDPLARAVHGTNPQNLIEYITRQKIYDSHYWKEECFGLNATDITEKAALHLSTVGGSYGDNRKPCHFACLILKMLQIQPSDEVVLALIENEDFKYVRALGAFYLRLTGRPKDIYETLEPLYCDFRRLRSRTITDWEILCMDEFVDRLLKNNIIFGIALPRLPKRSHLEEAGYLEPRKSVLAPDAEIATQHLIDLANRGSQAAQQAAEKLGLMKPIESLDQQQKVQQEEVTHRGKVQDIEKVYQTEQLLCDAGHQSRHDRPSRTRSRSRSRSRSWGRTRERKSLHSEQNSRRNEHGRIRDSRYEHSNDLLVHYNGGERRHRHDEYKYSGDVFHGNPPRKEVASERDRHRSHEEKYRKRDDDNKRRERRKDDDESERHRDKKKPRHEEGRAKEKKKRGETYGNLFKKKERKEDRLESDENSGRPITAPSVEEGSEEFWNVERAKLGLKPLTK